MLLEENGIRVSLLRSVRQYENSCQWYLAIVNDTDQDIGLGLTDIVVDGKPVSDQDAPVYLYDASLGAYQKTVCRLSCSAYDDDPMPGNICLRLWIMDFKKESILYTGQQEITLQLPPYEKE